MKDRDCKNCIYHTEDGCSSWECEYINRTEAIKLIEQIVRCKDCKHYGFRETETGGFPCCTNIIGAVKYMKPEDFCSQGERR